MKRFYYFALCWFFMSSPPTVMGADLVSPHDTSFFQDKSRGWFWYEDPTPPVEPKPEKKKEKPVEKSAPTPISQKSQAAEPAPLTTAWFRKNLDHYRDQAIDNPTPENVAAYYYLQRVMMDKAQKFTDTARYVVMSDPVLDENNRRPIATFAANEANRMASSSSDHALKAVAKAAGILFFFRSDCQYCHLQAPILALLQQRFGFEVYAVSLDGKAMPNGYFSDFHINSGQAQSLGVMSTPALFLMHPPNDYVSLSQGVLSLDELVGRLLLAANQLGIIDDKTYQTTRGQQSLPLMTQAGNSLSPQTLNDPGQLIDSLRRYAGASVNEPVQIREWRP